MIELVLGLTLLVIVMGIGFRAMIAINKQQTASANEAASLAIANSVRNAMVDYLGSRGDYVPSPNSAPPPDACTTTTNRFDCVNTSGIYYLTFNPADINSKEHLTISPAQRNIQSAKYNASKYKITAELFDIKEPVFDRRFVVEVAKVDQGKKFLGGSNTEKRRYEYFLLSVRPGVGGGTVKFFVKNGGPDDPDCVDTAGYPGNCDGVRHDAPIKRVTAIVAIRKNGVLTGEKRYARTGADGSVKIEGLPLNETLSVDLIARDRDDLISYYHRWCDDNNNGITTYAEIQSCSHTESNVWTRSTTDLNGRSFVCTPNDKEQDLGIIYLWPYARVKGTVKDYDTDAPIEDYAVQLRAIHVEDKNVHREKKVFEEITNAQGEYTFNVIPGYYYKVGVGNVIPNPDTEGDTWPAVIMNPDRRNRLYASSGNDQHRNNDPTNTYPYGLIDSNQVGMPRPTLYPGVVMSNENILIRTRYQPFPNHSLEIAVPQTTDYPYQLELRPGHRYYDVDSGRSNNWKNSVFELRPIGHYEFKLKVAQWSGGVVNRFIDAPAAEQAKLQAQVTSPNGLYLNVFNDHRKVYAHKNAPSLTGNEFPRLDFTGTFAHQAKRMIATTSDSSLYGFGGFGALVAAGRTYWDDGAVGDVPYMGPNFFDPNYLQNTSGDDWNQFETASFVLPFPSGWSGDLTPIIIVSNSQNQQLYVFYHGHPDFTKPVGVWPNGRQDGRLFTVNPSQSVFANQFSAVPTNTQSAAPTGTGVGLTLPVPYGYAINWGMTGLQAYSGVQGNDDDFVNTVNPAANPDKVIFDRVRWLRKALRARTGDPFGSAPPVIRVLPASQLVTVSGKIVRENDPIMPFFDPSDNNRPAKVATWGVSDAPGGSKFVSFNHEEPSTPVPPLGHTYSIQTIPSLNLGSVGNLYYGNGRKISITFEAPASPLTMQFFTMGRFFVKKYRATPPDPTFPNFYFEQAPVGDVANLRIEITDSHKTTMFASGIHPNMGYMSWADNNMMKTALNHDITVSRIYKGESPLFLATPPGGTMSGVDVGISGSPTFSFPIVYARLDTQASNPTYVDSSAPDSSLLGLPLSFCSSQFVPGMCSWYAGFVSQFPPIWMIPIHIFYASSDAIYGYKVLRAGTINLKVRTSVPNAPVPHLKVTLYMSSAKKHKLTGGADQWRKSCTVLTDAMGQIDYDYLKNNTHECLNNPAGPEPVPDDWDDEILKFDGFGPEKWYGPNIISWPPMDEHSGAKNIRFQIEQGPGSNFPLGKINPCPDTDSSTCAFDSAEGHPLTHEIILLDLVGPPSSAPGQSL